MPRIVGVEQVPSLYLESTAQLLCCKEAVWPPDRVSSRCASAVCFPTAACLTTISLDRQPHPTRMMVGLCQAPQRVGQIAGGELLAALDCRVGPEGCISLDSKLLTGSAERVSRHLLARVKLQRSKSQGL